jgi:hypothetical protein
VLNNRVVKAVALEEGDPTWVFPEESVTQALMTSLAASGRRLVAIAGLLPAGRAGWLGSGLEYNVFPPSGKCCLYGWAEAPQVTFEVELAPPGFRSAGSVGWEVSAEISVRCEARYDAACGMHVVEEFRPDVYGTPDDAVAAVARATDWLLSRCRAVSPGDWRARDPLEPCRGHA